MKSLLISFLCFAFYTECKAQSQSPTRNIIIITTDGFRWQEIFKGADSAILHNVDQVKDTALMCQQYWDDSFIERRKKLMPFFWNVIAKQGQLSGNREFKNDVNVKNLYKISYPGYNELFTGSADRTLIPNLAVRNNNINLLEWLNAKEEYKGKVVAYSSWNIMPYILAESENGLPVNSGYEMLNDSEDSINTIINQVQENVEHKTNCRFDMLTYGAAKRYLEEKHPKVLFLGLGETDEFAHKGEYDHYLQKAHQFDEMVAELWYFVQTDPFYKNNTTFIITTDHGRGKKASNWNAHGFWVGGSGQTWLATIGQGIAPLGELKEKGQIYTSQIAATISQLLGEKFKSNHPVDDAIVLKKIDNIISTPTYSEIVAAKK
ncbi:MAG: phosphoglyceromutase [Bacteroidota bacterium]